MSKQIKLRDLLLNENDGINKQTIFPSNFEKIKNFDSKAIKCKLCDGRVCNTNFVWIL